MATVLDCIRRIPAHLGRMGESYPERREAVFAYLAGENAAGVDKVVFIASGSSYNSAHMAKLFMKKYCRLQVELKYPNMFVSYEAELELDSRAEESGRGREVYVVISQGGETRLVYEALEKIRAAGKPAIAITADSDTSISRLAGLHVDMGCGQEEFLYRTIGFSASTAACCLLGMSIAAFNRTLDEEEESRILEDYQAMAGNLRRIEEQTEQWYRRHKFSLLRKNIVMLAGAGDLYPAANEGDIKLMEMAPMVTRSFELEEFIHGPQNAFDGSMLFFLLHRRGEDDEKVRLIARFLKEKIGFCSVVGEEPGDSRDLGITPVSRCFFALEYVTVFQVLGYFIATDRGRDLGRGVNAVIADYITKTL